MSSDSLLQHLNLESKQPGISNTGKFLIGLSGGVAVGLSILCYPFIAPAFRKHCLPYVPATQRQVRNVMMCIGEPPLVKSRILDIGSGDGRIVIAAAKNGYESHGVELNPWLVQYSRLSSLKNGTFWDTKFYRKDLWTFNVEPYNYIVIFGVEQMMDDLEKKIMSEVSMQTKIIACRFPFPNVAPESVIEDGLDTVWMYDGIKMQKQLKEQESNLIHNNIESEHDIRSPTS